MVLRSGGGTVSTESWSEYLWQPHIAHIWSGVEIWGEGEGGISLAVKGETVTGLAPSLLLTEL